MKVRLSLRDQLSMTLPKRMSSSSPIRSRALIPTVGLRSREKASSNWRARCGTTGDMWPDCTRTPERPSTHIPMTATLG